MKEQTRMENVDVIQVKDMCHQLKNLIATDALLFMICVLLRPARKDMNYLE